MKAFQELWQFFLAVFLFFFAVQRGAMAVMFELSDAPLVLVAAYGIQVVAGLMTAVGVGLGRLWSVAALIVLGICVASTALLEGFFLDLRSPFVAVSQLLVVAIMTGALALLLRYEFSRRSREDRAGAGEDGARRERERPPG